MTDKCKYCGTDVCDGGVYLDESGVDGVFCDDECAEAFIMDTVEQVDKE